MIYPAGRSDCRRRSIRGSHSSNTTCLTQVFFKSGKYLYELWRSLTLQTAHTANEAVLDK